MADYRCRIGWHRHPKVTRLKARLGAEAIASLQVLWDYTAEQHPGDGRLDGYAPGEVEASAEWGGSAGAFVSALVALRLLDEVEGGYAVHNWRKNQPWLAGAEERSELARLAGKASARKREIARLREAAEGDESTDRSTEWQRPVDGTLNGPFNGMATEHPTPSPSPSPSPSHYSEERSDSEEKASGIARAPARDEDDRPGPAQQPAERRWKRSGRGRLPCSVEDVAAQYTATLVPVGWAPPTMPGQELPPGLTAAILRILEAHPDRGVLWWSSLFDRAAKIQWLRERRWGLEKLADEDEIQRILTGQRDDRPRAGTGPKLLSPKGQRTWEASQEWLRRHAEQDAKEGP